MRAVAVLLLLALIAVLPAQAQQGAPSFAGRTVTIVVGYPTGGGYDRMARLVARHLPRFVPGSPTIIVQNMPGGNSIVAANHVYNTARPDGLTIGAFNRNLVLGQMVNVEGIRFDMTRFAWIGSPSAEATIFAIRSDLPYRTVADMQRADPPVIIGATGPGASTYDFPLLLKALLKFNVRIIPGYPSGTDILLAVERKEVDGRSGSYSSMKAAIDRGLIRPIIRTRASVPDIARLPVDEELAPNARAKALFALRSVPEIIGRPYVLPPATPPAIHQMYINAFGQMTKDREFLAEAERSAFDIEYTPGDQALKIVREVLGAPRDVVRVFTQFFNFE